MRIGIINNARNAKEKSEIANEKEILQEACINAMNKDKYGNLDKKNLENELSRKNVEVIGNGETLVSYCGK